MYIRNHGYYPFGQGYLDRKRGRIISRDLPPNGNRLWDVTTPPTLNPVTVDELKTFARIDGSDEDTILEGFITSVTKATEGYLGRALIEQTITLKMDWWPDMVVELPRPPLISVTSISTLDEDDTETTYSSSNYYVMTDGQPGRIVIKKSVSPPYNSTRYTGGYKIVFKCGYGTATTDVPEGIRTGIMLWATELYENRLYKSDQPPPQAKGVLDTYKILKV